MGGSLIGDVGVMMPAQDVRGAIERMMTDPPASLGVAVHLPEAGVHPQPDRTDEGGLSEVGAEARPEVVELVGSPMDRSGVKSHPVAEGSEEANEKGQPDDDEDPAITGITWLPLLPGVIS